MNCPDCGRPLAIADLLNEESSRACVGILTRYGGAGSWALSYLAMFSKSGHRVPWVRARRILEELEGLIAAGRFRRNRKEYRIDRAIVVEALQRMQGRRRELRLPLGTNGYLLEVAAGCGTTGAERSDGRERSRSDWANAQAYGRPSYLSGGGNEG